MIRPCRVADIETARRLVRQVGADVCSIDLMAPKAIGLCLQLAGVKTAAANILKQEMLSVGGDAAVNRGVIDGSVKSSDVLLMGSLKQVARVARKIEDQPFGLKRISTELSNYCGSLLEAKPLVWACGRFRFDLSQRPLIMGVLNVTPDSFSDGGRYADPTAAIERALQMAAQGADIIDIGGESTRPGSEPVSEQQELGRIMPVIEAILPKLSIPISVDTCKSAVASRALDAGASIVNDISGLRYDQGLASVVAKAGAGVILMHIQGTPRDMQQDPHYEDLLAEVTDYLDKSMAIAHGAGVSPDRIALDPGIGFGKTVEHNLSLIKNLQTFRQLGRPVVIGLSRKSFVGKRDGNAPPERRLPGSIAAAVLALGNGASVIRCHDVEETRQALAVLRAIREAD